MKVITDERCTAIRRRDIPKRPARNRSTLERLKSQKELQFRGSNRQCGDESILRAHNEGAFGPRHGGCHDFEGIRRASNISEQPVGLWGALAAERARKGEMAFSLCGLPASCHEKTARWDSVT